MTTPPDIKRRTLQERFITHPMRSEIVAFLLLIIAFFAGTRLSPHFLDRDYLLGVSSEYIEAGIIALPMTFIIVAGQIDISVASNMALTATIFGLLYDRAGFPLAGAIVVALLASLLLGAFNGVLVAKSRLPALAVTLGTFALYRGIAQAFIGDKSISGFPDKFNSWDARFLAGAVPMPLVVFLALAVVFGLILHRTYFGRWVYAIGTSEPAAEYSGVPVAKTQIALFSMTGLMAGICGLMMTSRYSVARFDIGQGLELDAITAVVLGGTNIFGGRGTILGTVIAFFLMVIVRTGMGLHNIKIEKQLIVVGLLLLFSIILPNLLRRQKD